MKTTAANPLAFVAAPRFEGINTSGGGTHPNSRQPLLTVVAFFLAAAVLPSCQPTPDADASTTEKKPSTPQLAAVVPLTQPSTRGQPPLPLPTLSPLPPAQTSVRSKPADTSAEKLPVMAPPPGMLLAKEAPKEQGTAEEVALAEVTHALVTCRDFERLLKKRKTREERVRLGVSETGVEWQSAFRILTFSTEPPDWCVLQKLRGAILRDDRSHSEPADLSFLRGMTGDEMRRNLQTIKQTNNDRELAAELGFKAVMLRDYLHVALRKAREMNENWLLPELLNKAGRREQSDDQLWAEAVEILHLKGPSSPTRTHP
jgi:hypothetical protein